MPLWLSGMSAPSVHNQKKCVLTGAKSFGQNLRVGQESRVIPVLVIVISREEGMIYRAGVFTTPAPLCQGEPAAKNEATVPVHYTH